MVTLVCKCGSFLGIVFLCLSGHIGFKDELRQTNSIHCAAGVKNAPAIDFFNGGCLAAKILHKQHLDNSKMNAN